MPNYGCNHVGVELRGDLGQYMFVTDELEFGSGLMNVS